MAKIRFNKSSGDLQGKIGGLVYAHRADGEVIVRNRPVSYPPSTERQKENQNRFALANWYLRQLKQQPELYAPYQAAGKLIGKRACNLALADFLHGPDILSVNLSGYKGRRGERISIEVTDDFGVVSVPVAIRDLEGGLVEQGAAVPQDAEGRVWIYETQTDLVPGQFVVLEIQALDRPGNVRKKCFDHACRAAVN